MDFSAMRLAIFLISSLGIGIILLQLTHILISTISTNILGIKATQELLKVQENKHMKMTKIKQILQIIKTLLFILILAVFLIVILFILIGCPIIVFLNRSLIF